MARHCSRRVGEVNDKTLPVCCWDLYSCPFHPRTILRARALVAQQMAQVPFLPSQLTQFFTQSRWQQHGTT